ncbi:hypothetical protein C8A03DRAFT_30078 [Achaetomium macrosporum]|uniref:chitinase n=1 Tax=Achaetomium macrosporum TaxID=79813 RepID=A0AAN7HFX2_9PEZI|nr:hypothetical protein C8A03DRAFT_30078 [Achaetomium macrosporum]
MAHQEAPPSNLGRRYAVLWLCLATALAYFVTRRELYFPPLDLAINIGPSDKSVVSVAESSSRSEQWPSPLRRDDYSYSKDKPCANGACCGSYFGGTTGTCGYGPTYCGADFTSNCNATAECGKDAVPAGKTCPLNVCCSEWGFCGTTTDFCLPSKNCQSHCVEHPSPPAGKNGGSVLNRVIGYYEAWSARRDCYKFPPGAIPVQGSTHVNFAFAYIDPKTFKITTMDSTTPASLFTETADVHTPKSDSENLEVWVSIGGWNFSDSNTATQPVFSNIAGSAKNRQAFANNLVSFMKGVPDRGGKTEDTKSFISLLKTMRATFDAAGGYGISFTIPSSYWYLRWFDVPGILEYADWANLMSKLSTFKRSAGKDRYEANTSLSGYDIHGVWDGNNPIGSHILAHTNLTEIQLAVELLWRVGMPPEKVVLGMGFYGRSFQLEHESCGGPGCPFKGPADAGICSNNAGTLAYFEIMDILDKQKPKAMHDEHAAIKYVQFGANKDQWISYDDKDTFEQKVDWANGLEANLSLGGLMIWSIDQEDTKFTALKGLTGKDLPTFSDALAATKSAAGNWASQNGQKCIMTECLGDDRVGGWGAGWAIAPGGGAFKNNCGKNENKYILCPLNQMPSSCTWRGGETKCACHGQCHAGEVTLFHSRHGSRSCCRPGWQAFCCESNTWSNLVVGCHFPKDYSCAANEHLVQYRQYPTYYDSMDGSTYFDKQACDDNECADWEIEMLTDDYGDGFDMCNWFRSRVLCCKPPANLNAFLPVPLDKLFPTLPPTTSVPNFDLQQLASATTYTGQDSVPEAFGMVVIDGPQDVVTNLATRDVTHLEFLNCEPSRKHDMKTYTLHYVCMDDSSDSNCDAVHEGGAEGTIIRLPEGCGYATYGVVHEIRPAVNVTVPEDVLKRAPANAVVYELEFSYDFKRVKRGSSDVFIRIDYGWACEYWDTIVAGDPIRSKRGLDETLDKRFWSPKSNMWRNLISTVHAVDETGPQGDYKPQLVARNFSRVIYQQDSTSKCNDTAFMAAKLSGIFSSAIRWGFTMDAYGFFDSKMDLSGDFAFKGRGELNIAGATKTADLWLSDISDYSFSHPGIVSFSPKIILGVALAGAGHIDADFTVSFLGGSGSTLMVHAPPSLGNMSGDLRGESVDDAWSGKVSASRTSGAPADGTIFGADSMVMDSTTMVMRSWMDVEVYELGSTLVAGKAQFLAQNSHYIRVSSDGSTVNVTDGEHSASVEAYASSISSAWETDESSHDVGCKSFTQTVHSAGAPGEDPKDNKPPKWSGMAALAGYYMNCSRGSELKCLYPYNLSMIIPDFDVHPANGLVYERRKRWSPALDLTEVGPLGTGGKRPFTVKGTNGRSFTIYSHTYPNGQSGNSLLGINPNAGFWTLADPLNCESYAMTDDGDPNDGEFVTEHTVELSYLGQLLSFMLTGSARMPGGSVYAPYSARPIDYGLLEPNSFFQRPWSQWDPTGQHPYPNLSPLDEVFQMMGDTVNPDGFVNADATLNGFKMRVWNGNAPVADDTWAENQWDDTSDDRGPARAEEAMSAIRTTLGVFSYVNARSIHDHMTAIVNGRRAMFQRFDEAVNRVSGQTIHTSRLHIEFWLNVMVPRIESVDNWVNSRLNGLQQVWQARLDYLQNNPSNSQGVANADGILESTKALRAQVKTQC